MGYGKISAKQQEILDYIKEEILKRGYPPAVREICEAVNLRSTSSVHSHLETLEKNGYIRRVMIIFKWFVPKWSVFRLSDRLLPERQFLQRRILTVIFRFPQNWFRRENPLF